MANKNNNLLLWGGGAALLLWLFGSRKTEAAAPTQTNKTKANTSSSTTDDTTATSTLPTSSTPTVATQSKPLNLSPGDQKIWDVVAAFESRNNYRAVNEKESGGIAYGVLQAISANGGVDRIIQNYANYGGAKAGELKALGSLRDINVARAPKTVALLREVANEPAMKKAQRDYFMNNYFRPAMQLAASLGGVTEAEKVVLFDAFIHYGNKEWVKNLFRKGFDQWLTYMRGNLSKKYSKPGVHRTYNLWRADWLRQLRQSNPSLQGTIVIKAPQWGSAIRVG